jgi:hypothetical protein
MKIAICFSGQLRTGIQTAPNIKRYIGDLAPVCDYFVHTWDHQSPNHVASELIPVDKNIFSEFYKLYNPIAMTVEPYADKKAPAGVWGGYRVDPVTGRKVISMFESIYKSNRLKKTYEEDNGFIYDYVVRIRTDSVFHQEKTLRSDIGEHFSKTMTLPESDSVFMAAYHKENYNDGHKLEDIFWIARSATMDKITEFYQVRADSGREDDSQMHMAAWVRNDLVLTYHPLSNSKIKLLRVGNTSSDVMNFDSVPD